MSEEERRLSLPSRWSGCEDVYLDALMDLLEATERVQPEDRPWTVAQLASIFAAVDVRRLFLPRVYLAWIWSLLLQRAFHTDATVADTVVYHLLRHIRTSEEARGVSEYLVARCTHPDFI